jgi:hypothetical protein
VEDGVLQLQPRAEGVSRNRGEGTAKRRKRRLPEWLTEETWLAQDEREYIARKLATLQEYVVPGITPRKCCLCEIACARRVMHLFPEDLGRRAVEFGERAVEDSAVSHTEHFVSLLAEARARLQEPASSSLSSQQPQDALLLVVHEFAVELLQLNPEARWLGNWAASVVVAAGLNYWEAEHRPQMALLRDIFGNPIRPVTFSPDWRTDTAVSLARQMYESRDFSAMPILADALQDAGCDNDDILSHCRDPQGVHVRGCWVVDLVLDKQ